MASSERDSRIAGVEGHINLRERRDGEAAQLRTPVGRASWVKSVAERPGLRRNNTSFHNHGVHWPDPSRNGPGRDGSCRQVVPA
ncbi:uncharacterized protein LOC144163365 isoform X3 [Haemaphysalis longicornis]